MKSTKNIVLLTPGFPENSDDTTCIPALQAFVKALKSDYGDSLSIQIVSFQYPFVKGSYEWNGLRCYSAGGKNSKFPSKWSTWLSVIKFLRKYHQQHPIDIIHAFWLSECSLVGKWVASITGAKLICHVMGQDVRLSNKYLKYLNLKNTFIVANSPFSANELQRITRFKVDKIIPFGIETKDFPDTLPGERTIDLLGVGSLIEIKNFSLFVELFAELKKSFPDLTGSIVGEGVMEAQLQKKIKEISLGNSLKLEGKLIRSEVLRKMAGSKILLHTSQFESAGYVFLEALHSGMKVVCFNTGFLPQVQGAYSCTSRDEMVKCLKSLLSYQQEFSRKEVPLISETAKEIWNIYNSL